MQHKIFITKERCTDIYMGQVQHSRVAKKLLASNVTFQHTILIFCSSWSLKPESYSRKSRELSESSAWLSRGHNAFGKKSLTSYPTSCDRRLTAPVSGSLAVSVQCQRVVCCPRQPGALTLLGETGSAAQPPTVFSHYL